MRSAPSVPPLDETVAIGAVRPSSDHLVVVSGQLPAGWSTAADWQPAANIGNLNAILRTLLRDRSGVWIGWPGDRSPEVAGSIQQGGTSVRSIALSASDERDAIEGFGERVLWPLLHGHPIDCRFDSALWQAYRRVNRKFARAVARALARQAEPGNPVWVHDPLLINVAAELRQLGHHNSTALSLHLPFPGPDTLLQLPWRTRLLAGLLAYRQIGFQSTRDLVNFVDCVRDMVPDVEMSSTAEGLVHLTGSFGGGRFEVQAGVFPAGVDAAAINTLATSPAVEKLLHHLRARGAGRQLVFAIDPLRRTQGVLEKLDAFAELLRRRSELVGKVTLEQIVVPHSSPAGQSLRHEIERRVGEINGAFSRLDWQPVHYRYQTLSPNEILASYRAADLALFTPLREGMNLSAKEFCAAQHDDRGALVLSEFAGAAPELATGAMLVNPHAVNATARCLGRALSLGQTERSLRMRRMRQAVRLHDVAWWATSFLNAWGATRIDRLSSDAAPAPLPAESPSLHH